MLTITMQNNELQITSNNFSINRYAELMPLRTDSVQI